MCPNKIEPLGDFSIAKGERLDYEYTVHVRAWETFGNLMRGHGVSLREGDRNVTFSTEKRIDMKKLKERGLLWSYVIAKVRRSKEIVETG
jgi:hypothetical protein